MIFVFKVAGAIAETGASLDDVFKIASEANNNIRTLGVALSPCILPEAGKPTFEINHDEIFSFKVDYHKELELSFLQRLNINNMEIRKTFV